MEWQTIVEQDTHKNLIGYLLITKEIRVTLLWGNLADTTWIRIPNYMNHDTSYITYHLLRHSQKDAPSLMWFSWLEVYLVPNMKKQSGNSNWGIFYEEIGLKSSKISMSWKVKKKKDWVISPWIDKKRLRRHLNEMCLCDFWLDPVFVLKETYANVFRDKVSQGL